jgi:signal transduction histidine kinase
MTSPPNPEPTSDGNELVGSSSQDSASHDSESLAPPSTGPQSRSSNNSNFYKNGRTFRLLPGRWPDRLTIFLALTFGMIIYIFYTSDFRNTLENFFRDQRTNWMPEAAPSKNVVVITIDDSSIYALEDDPLRLRVDSKKRPYLSVGSLTQAASILANTQAAAVALLMPEHAFPSSDFDMIEMRDIVKFDSRFVIGTTAYNQVSPNVEELPSVLAEISNQVAGYETFRSRSNAIVRSLPYTSYRGLSEVETLPVKIAGIADPTFGTQYGRYYLKHFPPQHFPSVPIKQLITDPNSVMDQFNGKVVIVGYIVERNAGFQTAEQMMTNTPLTGQSQALPTEVSTTWLVANAVENLILRETIVTASDVTTLAQTITVAALCGASWELGSLTAAATTIVIWILLLTIHSFLYRWMSLSIPLADTFLATALVSIFAATRRMKTELMAMADKEANASAKSEIAATQSHFLSGFASWLKQMTEAIVAMLHESKGAKSQEAETQKIYQHAYAAGEDFREYLEAIRQIPNMESISKKRVIKQNIELEDFIKTIFRRFDVKAQKRGVEFLLDIAENARTIKSNPQLLDAILFNLVSNAFKYGPDSAKIMVRIRKTSSRGISISVIDRGMGIPSELHERIFERFYRIRDERMYKTKGTGLGLYLCRFFAENLGGRIEVISEVGSGSEFRVVLP